MEPAYVPMLKGLYSGSYMCLSITAIFVSQVSSSVPREEGSVHPTYQTWLSLPLRYLKDTKIRTHRYVSDIIGDAFTQVFRWLPMLHDTS